MTDKRPVLVLDCDGVLTDGKIYVSARGKEFKVFGPDDHDALDLIRNKLEVLVVSADRRGSEITRRRVEQELGLKFELVSAQTRGAWMRENFPTRYIIYMGDGYWDHLVHPYVDYLICPSNSNAKVLKVANFITSRVGGDRAVAEAIDHIDELLDKKRKNRSLILFERLKK